MLFAVLFPSGVVLVLRKPTPQNGFQFLKMHGFGEKVIHAGGQATRLHPFGGVGGYRDHRRARAFLGLLALAAMTFGVAFSPFFKNPRIASIVVR